MRKYIMGISILAVILAVFCIWWPVPTETYTNVGYGYSFNYPSTHYIRQEPDDYPYPDKYDRWMGISIDSKYNKARENDTLFYLLSWPPAPKDLDLKSFTEFYMKDAFRNDYEITLTHFKNIDGYCFGSYERHCIFENSKKERFKFTFKESSLVSKTVLNSLVFE